MHESIDRDIQEREEIEAIANKILDTIFEWRSLQDAMKQIEQDKEEKMAKNDSLAHLILKLDKITAEHVDLQEKYTKLKESYDRIVLDNNAKFERNCYLNEENRILQKKLDELTT